MRRWNFKGPVVLAILVLSYSSAGTEAKPSNVVTQWVSALQTAVRTAGIQNQLAGKYYGLLGLSIHKAITEGGAPPAALAAYAGHTVLSSSFPWSQGTYDLLLANQTKGFSSAEKNAAKATAVPLAKALLKNREADASIDAAGFQPASAGTLFAYQFTPGQKNALYPQLASATPFTATDTELLAIVDNSDPAKGPVFQPPKNDYAKTYEFGAKKSAKRKQYDTDSAPFWADGANTSTIAGHWLNISLEVLPSSYSVEDTALFLARAGAAAYDASIAGWKVKYSRLHWRPITAFIEGYPGVKADPSWTPLLTTPNHPEYPSGHQVTVGAILEVLLRTLGGKDNVTFKISSEGTPWITRSYNSLTAAAVEVGDSRLYGGIHFPSSNADGLKLGRLVGGKVYDKIAPKSVSIRSADGKAALSNKRK